LKRGIGTSAAIIIAAIIISAGLFATDFDGLGVTRTLTRVVTSTVAASSIPLHEVTFNETGSGCGNYAPGPPIYKIYYVPSWYATLGNITIVQPSNATLPLPVPEGQNSPAFAAISKIIFTVPDGSYSYHVALGQDGSYNGTVVVNGSDMVIQIMGPLCSPVK
jgi:hypothetical protein